MTEPITFIRLDEVVKRTGISRATLYRRLNAGLFPVQIKISIQSVGWIEREVDQYNLLLASGASDAEIAALCKSEKPHFEVRLPSKISSAKSLPRDRAT